IIGSGEGSIITVIVGRINRACSDQVRRPEMGGPAPARSEAPRASSAAAAACEAPAEFQVYKTRASVRRPPRMRLQKNRADFGRLCTAAGGDSRGRKMPVIPRITELACVELARRHDSPIRSAG